MLPASPVTQMERLAREAPEPGGCPLTAQMENQTLCPPPGPRAGTCNPAPFTTAVSTAPRSHQLTPNLSSANRDTPHGWVHLQQGGGLGQDFGEGGGRQPFARLGGFQPCLSPGERSAEPEPAHPAAFLRFGFHGGPFTRR